MLFRPTHGRGCMHSVAFRLCVQLRRAREVLLVAGSSICDYLSGWLPVFLFWVGPTNTSSSSIHTSNRFSFGASRFVFCNAADRREIVDMTWVLGMARRDCAVLSAGCRSLLYRITPLQVRVTTHSSDLWRESGHETWEPRASAPIVSTTNHLVESWFICAALWITVYISKRSACLQEARGRGQAPQCFIPMLCSLPRE